jgi:large-conductance mechanosensitive channel
VYFADVTMEDATVLMNNMNSRIRFGGLITLVIQVVSLLLMVFIIWRAVSASRRYKEKVVDSEKEHLIEQMAKLREVNARLITRNQMLAEKNLDLQNRLNAAPQVSDQQWFG